MQKSSTWTLAIGSWVTSLKLLNDSDNFSKPLIPQKFSVSLGDYQVLKIEIGDALYTSKKRKGSPFSCRGPLHKGQPGNEMADTLVKAILTKTKLREWVKGEAQSWC